MKSSELQNELQKLFDYQIIFLFKYILKAGAHLPLCSRKHVYFNLINYHGSHVIQHWEIMSHRTPFAGFGN